MARNQHTELMFYCKEANVLQVTYYCPGGGICHDELGAASYCGRSVNGGVSSCRQCSLGFDDGQGPGVAGGKERSVWGDVKASDSAVAMHHGIPDVRTEPHARNLVYILPK